jgi:hypothetical protein
MCRANPRRAILQTCLKGSNCNHPSGDDHCDLICPDLPKVL